MHIVAASVQFSQMRYMLSVVHLSLSLAGFAAMAAMALMLLVLVLHLPQALHADAFPYALQWKRLVPGIVGGALVQRDSLVFAGTTDGRVLAIGRDDGLRRWHRRGFGCADSNRLSVSL